jgi:hypothetical protein
MQKREAHNRWLSLALCIVASPIFASCQPPPPPPAVPVAVPAPQPTLVQREPQPGLVYCVPHVPSTEQVVFTLEYDGSDGRREPRFSDPATAPNADEGTETQAVSFSNGARELCPSPDKPIGRRYVLRVPINAEPRHLDEFVRYAARHGYDQPIFTLNKAIVAAQIANAEYAYSAISSEEVAATIGTTTIEANANGQYELRARVTDGYELSTPIGVVTMPPNPELTDCDSKLAEAVQLLCAHMSRPCERVTLVGVNDIGPLLTVLGYVQSITELPALAIALQQRHPGLDESPYLDGSFRRAHRVKRFFAALKPETETRKLTLAESLAKNQVGLHGAIPTSLAAETGFVTDVTKKLASKEWTEVGKARPCDHPGRIAASLVLDKTDKVRMYAERVTVTDRSEVLLRAYYDEAQRLRLVVNSETTDLGEAWDAYLVLGQDGCPTNEQIAARSELGANLLHWELKPLANPRDAYSEPLCIGQLP